MPIPGHATNIQTETPRRDFTPAAKAVLSAFKRACKDEMRRRGGFSVHGQNLLSLVAFLRDRIRLQPAPNMGAWHSDTALYEVRVCLRIPRDGASVSYIDLRDTQLGPRASEAYYSVALQAGEAS